MAGGLRAPPHAQSAGRLVLESTVNVEARHAHGTFVPCSTVSPCIALLSDEAPAGAGRSLPPAEVAGVRAPALSGDSHPSVRPAAEQPDWWRNTVTLTAGNLVTNTGWSAAFAFMPLAVKEMGVAGSLELWVGVMIFGYYLTSCLFTPVWGALADHYGRKTMILRAGFGMAAGFSLLSMMTHPLPFLIVIVLTGLGNGYVPAAQALVATTAPRHRVGGALALTQAGAWTGTLFGPLAGAALLAVLPNARSLFLGVAATLLIGGLLALFVVREHYVRPTHALRIDLRADIRRLWDVPDLKILYFFNLIVAFTVFGALAVVSLYTLRLLDANPGFWGLRVETWMAITAMGFTLASIAILPLWGRVLNRYPSERVLPVLLAGVFVTSLLAPLVRDPFELTIARVLYALFISGMPPAVIRMITERSPPGMQARTLSYGTATQQMGSALAPLTAGLLTVHLGLRAYFWVASGLVLVALVLWFRRGRQRGGHASP